MFRPSAILVAVSLCTVWLHVAGCTKSDDSQAAGTKPVAAAQPATPALSSHPPARGPNVLLIAVDTLRADRLGCYGSDLGATPRIDALATESVRFEEAYAHAPWTLPSFASLLTSLTPPQHGAGGQLGQFRGLRPEVRTVAECFRDAGYATAGIINVGFLTTSFGMSQGFDHVDYEVYPNNVEVRVARRTTDAAIKWLSERPERSFFLMVHYFDPHLVYNPPLVYRQRFAAPEDQDNADWVFGTRQHIGQLRQGKMNIDAATIRRAEKLYNGEVAYADHEVGRLLEALGGLQLADSTIVVFTANHGEEFLDHRGFEHGHTLYDELVHVPLLIRYPGRLKPGVVTTPIGQIDVAPTLCALTSVAPEPSFVGRSLLGLIDKTETEVHPIIFEGNFWGPPFRGWLHGAYKLIVRPGGVELYNLDSDPGEQRDLSAVEPARLQKMVADFKLAHKAMAAHDQDRPQPVKLDPDEMERLRSLGYLE